LKSGACNSFKQNRFSLRLTLRNLYGNFWKERPNFQFLHYGFFWSSFCSALAPVDKIPILALCGATLATYALSIIIRGKMEVGDIANASLAGGVAVGASVANITPGWSMIIGLAAGAISVVGLTVVQPRLQKLTGGVYTCGVHNLHGMPGVFGGLVAAALVAAPLWQLTGIVLAVILALTMGVSVGFIVSRFGGIQTPYEDKD
jgi:ammonium transporter Rh